MCKALTEAASLFKSKCKGGHRNIRGTKLGGHVGDGIAINYLLGAQEAGFVRLSWRPVALPVSCWSNVNRNN